MMWMSPARARWFGYLYHAHASGLTLSAYATRQGLALGDLLAWDQYLREQGVAVPERHRPRRFVAVELTP